MGFEWLEDMVEWVMGNDIGGQLRNWYRDTRLNTDTETRTQKNKRRQSSGYLAPGSVSLHSGWARSRRMKPGRGAVTWPCENRESLQAPVRGSRILGRLQSMASLGVGHDWVTSLSRIGEGNGNPLQYSCLENPSDGVARWAAVYGVSQSWTRLKRLSSSSSSSMFLQDERDATLLLHTFQT